MCGMMKERNRRGEKQNLPTSDGKVVAKRNRDGKGRKRRGLAIFLKIVLLREMMQETEHRRGTKLTSDRKVVAKWNRHGKEREEESWQYFFRIIWLCGTMQETRTEEEQKLRVMGRL